MDLGTIGLVGSIGSSVLGGIFGGRDAREAEREQRRLLAEARGLIGQGRDAVSGAEELAIRDIDEANVILADVEPAILAGLDEQLRIRVAQQVLRQEQQAARTQQQLATAGLDATTVMPQVQRQQALGQADAVGALTAQFAGQRASAITGARQAQAQGLMARAGTRGNFAGMQANLYGQEAALVGNTQVVPANTGAAIGQIGGSIFGGLANYSALQNQQQFQQELLGRLPQAGALAGSGMGPPAGTQNMDRIRQLMASTTIR